MYSTYFLSSATARLPKLSISCSPDKICFTNICKDYKYINATCALVLFCNYYNSAWKLHFLCGKIVALLLLNKSTEAVVQIDNILHKTTAMNYEIL